MTREEVIKELELIAQVTMWNDRREAVEMAIEALSEGTKGYSTMSEEYDEAIESLQTEVVRCKDCRHSRVYQTDSKGTMRTNCVAFVVSRTVTDEGFCSWGERREE